MILGYGIIAVPTGIVTVEMAYASRHQRGVRMRNAIPIVLLTALTASACSTQR